MKRDVIKLFVRVRETREWAETVSYLSKCHLHFSSIPRRIHTNYFRLLQKYPQIIRSHTFRVFIDSHFLLNFKKGYSHEVRIPIRMRAEYFMRLETQILRYNVQSRYLHRSKG